jgi:hypothetical protein
LFKQKNVLSDPVTQKFSTDNIRREFNNTEGIELLKVIVSNCGRFPAKITNVSFGYGVQGKEYRHYFSRYTIGLFPHVLSPDKTVPSLPQKIDDGDEFSVYYITGMLFVICKRTPIIKNLTSRYTHM